MHNTLLKRGLLLQPELRQAFFSYDDGETYYEGFTLGETWNGWAVPYFVRHVAATIPHERYWSAKLNLFTVGDGLTWEEYFPEYESEGPLHPAERALLYQRACATNTGTVEVAASQLKELLHGYYPED